MKRRYYPQLNVRRHLNGLFFTDSHERLEIREKLEQDRTSDAEVRRRGVSKINLGSWMLFWH